MNPHIYFPSLKLTAELQNLLAGSSASLRPGYPRWFCSLVPHPYFARLVFRIPESHWLIKVCTGVIWFLEHLSPSWDHSLGEQGSITPEPYLHCCIPEIRGALSLTYPPQFPGLYFETFCKFGPLQFSQAPGWMLNLLKYPYGILGKPPCPPGHS